MHLIHYQWTNQVLVTFRFQVFYKLYQQTIYIKCLRITHIGLWFINKFTQVPHVKLYQLDQTKRFLEEQVLILGGLSSKKGWILILGTTSWIWNHYPREWESRQILSRLSYNPYVAHSSISVPNKVLGVGDKHRDNTKYFNRQLPH